MNEQLNGSSMSTPAVVEAAKKVHLDTAVAGAGGCIRSPGGAATAGMERRTAPPIVLRHGAPPSSPAPAAPRCAATGLDCGGSSRRLGIGAFDGSLSLNPATSLPATGAKRLRLPPCPRRLRSPLSGASDMRQRQSASGAFLAEATRPAILRVALHGHACRASGPLPVTMPSGSWAVAGPVGHVSLQRAAHRRNEPSELAPFWRGSGGHGLAALRGLRGGFPGRRGRLRFDPGSGPCGGFRLCRSHMASGSDNELRTGALQQVGQLGDQ